MSSGEADRIQRGTPAYDAWHLRAEYPNHYFTTPEYENWLKNGSDKKMTVMIKGDTQEEINNKYVHELISRGYIVIPPSSRKVRRIGRLEIITDPIGISFRWVKK